MTNSYLQENYIIRIRSVKVWPTLDKKSCIRFRINYSYKSGFDGLSAERCLSKLIWEYIESDFDFYSTFLSKKSIPFDRINGNKIEEFLLRNKIKIILMPYGHLAGLQFPEKNYKNLFLLKYSDCFPSSSIIK